MDSGWLVKNKSTDFIILLHAYSTYPHRQIQPWTVTETRNRKGAELGRGRASAKISDFDGFILNVKTSYTGNS